jgi:chromosome segregation ATPase
MKIYQFFCDFLVKMEKSNLMKPHFNIDDLTKSDLDDKCTYFDPYHALRRPIEPERLQSIYQHAFIYDLLYKFAKEYLPDVNNLQGNNVNSSSKATDTKIDTIKDKVIEYLLKIDLREDQNESINKKNSETIVDSLWDTDDLNILRKNFTDIKENNIKLKSRLAILEKENGDLREKYENLKISTQSMPSEIKSLEKENERLYIRVEELESRYASYSNELDNVDKIINKISNEKDELKKLNQDLKCEKLKLEYELNKSQSKLDTVKLETKMHYTSLVEKFKFNNEKEIQKLNRVIGELGEKLDYEKKQNDKSKKALDHLRVHFVTSCTSNQTDRIDDKNIKIF